MKKPSNSRVCRLLGLVLVVTCIVALLPVDTHVHGYETENTFKSEGDIVEEKNECGGCTIIYRFVKTTGILYRIVNCGDQESSWDIPGWSTNRASTSDTSSQSGVETVTSDFGEADVWEWPLGDDGFHHKGSMTTCEITYLAPTKPVPVALDPSGAILDKEGNVLMGYSCSWKDDTIQYTFTNNTNSDLIVTWNSTPFSQIVKAGKQMICKKYTRTIPDVVLRDIIINNAETGGVTVLEVVTFIPSTTVYIPINALKKISVAYVAI